MILLGATKGSYGGSGLCALKYYRSRRRHFCFHSSPSTAPVPRADAVPAFINEIEGAHGIYEALDRLIDSVRDALVQAPDEHYARHLVENMALALQGSLLARHGPPAVADAFCATRLGLHRGSSYGAIDAKIDTDAILFRAMPAV